MIDSWSMKQDIVTLTKSSHKKEHFDNYGHHLDYLEEQHKDKVRFMSAAFCRNLWKDHFTNVESHYLRELYDLKSIDSIIKNANGRDFYDLYEKRVQSLVGWEKNTEIYYCNGSTNCIKSEWGIICKYWVTSIYEDNYNLIINPIDQKFIISIEYETFIGSKEQNLTLYLDA